MVVFLCVHPCLVPLVFTGLLLHASYFWSKHFTLVISRMDELLPTTLCPVFVLRGERQLVCLKCTYTLLYFAFYSIWQYFDTLFSVRKFFNELSYNTNFLMLRIISGSYHVALLVKSRSPHGSTAFS